MRFDDIAPRTLLLGAGAAWALLALGLAVAGMGGALPESTAQTIPPPQLPAGSRAGARVLGPPTQYAATAERPLFSSDRRPKPFVLQTANGGAPAEAPAFDLVLTSVLITPQASIAIVQKPDGSDAWRVRVGEAPDAFPGWRLTGLAPRSATFAGPEGEKTLELRVFNGQGGTAPTPGAVMPTPVEQPGPVPVPAPVPPPPAPPPTDASAAPDPQQIEAIRRRIEARRAQMRQQQQNAQPSSSAPPAPTR